MKTAAKKQKTELQIFQDYCWSFYSPGEIHGDFFKNALTREEMNAACLLVSKGETFEGDTFDREKARDLLLKVRGEKTEYYG